MYVMPSVAAGVIMDTPPGGWRGSIAVDVVFLILDPDVIVALDDDPDTVPDTVEL